MEAETAPLYDSLVIGAGPAGLTAALQLARFNRRVMVFDPGGGRSSYHQVNHNYLGFPGGLKARELLELGRRQVREYPVAFCNDRVCDVSREDGAFRAGTEGGSRFRGRTVVFATGVRDHFPLFPEWERYVGRSLFWCITCDGYSTRGKRIVVVGNDGHAGVTALQFLQFTHHVTMLTNDAECRIEAPVRSALEEQGVTLVVDRIVKVWGDDGILAQLSLESGHELPLDFLFSLQGQSPNSELARAIGVEVSHQGYILADQDQQTNVPGVFAAGDVTRDLAHQVATAVHEGNTAAQAANYYLYADWQKHETYE
ncbi:MAG TPA: NAD(P)/FAD-dependent oxidoreductase [Tepidiformaceae bacterium]|nr:NAD(P)/FAD-dependent oxidoreductase [Tepidiformaceae bacterium]